MINDPHVYRTLREANAARQIAWCAGGDPAPDLAFRAVELAGEVGEACNVIKKIERERHGWRGSRATNNDLADELADVVICADLTAMTAGIDLDAAVAGKFNATSEKIGLPQRLTAQTAAPSPDPGAVGDSMTWKDEVSAPASKMLVTYRTGERDITTAALRIWPDGTREWIDRDGRTTVTHHSYAAPTHWLCEAPELPARPDTTRQTEGGE